MATRSNVRPMPSPRGTNREGLFVRTQVLTRDQLLAFDAAGGIGGGNADKAKEMRLAVENLLNELHLDEKHVGRILETLDEYAPFDRLDDNDPNAERAHALVGDDAEGVDRVLSFLKSRGLDADALEKCRELLAGFAAEGDDDLVDASGQPKKAAFDRLPPRLRLAALDRLNDRHTRREESFLRRFPEAKRIG
jgi:hypothetical protein